MFGYIVPDYMRLTDVQKARYRSVYCGVCRALQKRNGAFGALTLSNDLTFLALLLHALEEGEECMESRRCYVHPMHRHDMLRTPVAEYAADMNVALAYHKCLDDWMDDRKPMARLEAGALQKQYEHIRKRHPKQCEAIEQWLDEIHAIETDEQSGIDAPMNSTGRMLGTLFCRGDEFFQSSLRTIGEGLGRFIYLMDAYEDLQADIKKKRFNPLKGIHENEDFESFCFDGLTMAIADSTTAFESLPILQDADLIRNVLYSGVWSKYALLQKKRSKQKGD